MVDFLTSDLQNLYNFQGFFMKFYDTRIMKEVCLTFQMKAKLDLKIVTIDF